MDRRMLLAIALTIGVIFATNLIFPPQKPAPKSAADSAAVASPATSPAAPAIASAVPAVGAPTSTPAAAAPAPITSKVDTAAVQTARATVAFTSLGAAPLRVTMRDHKLLPAKAVDAQLTSPAGALLRYAVVTAGDTVRFDRTAFTATTSSTGGVTTLEYTGTERGITLAARYTLDTTDVNAYLTRARVTITGAPTPAFLRIGLPAGFQSQETKPEEDATHLAYAFKPEKRSADVIAFGKLDPGERRIERGPFTWLVAKSKYFMVGLLVYSVRSPIAELQVTGQPKTGKYVVTGDAQAFVELAGGPVSFELYHGPQEYIRLHKLGRDFENSNPYGGWLQGAVQPFATIVMRLLLWPLNQTAMRSSIKMQRIQPELAKVQEKFKSDPQKLQAEMMKVYKAHDMSPFSAFSGCLPMLIPLPILFALFFVFQNTIEFRGVSFLWLPDISLGDPFYVMPLLMGASMFVLSWIGMKNAPPNPQTQMMSWLLPGMMTLMFLNFASGLTLYYFVQNLAALPQQWLIANERSKGAGVPAPAS
ncbi:MAG: membrane protein insertase YidC [Gemmatimonadetes bacterium]|nr:membrane protein insertase YidC [Gemmatimonadota bacterium]